MVTTRNSGSLASAFRISFENYLDTFGTTVTLRVTTETKDSMNRVTGSTTATTTGVKADIQWLNKKDLLYLNLGDVKVGDGMIFFKYNQTIAIHDEVEFNGKRYRVTSEVEGEVVGGDVTYLGYIIRRNAQT